MTNREREIFMFGLRTGLLAQSELEKEFPTISEEPRVKRKYKTKKSKSGYTERARKGWETRRAKKSGKYDGLAKLNQDVD